jgi:hypothetical protein
MFAALHAGVADCPRLSSHDADLQTVLEAWNRLPPEIRELFAATVRAETDAVNLPFNGSRMTSSGAVYFLPQLEMVGRLMLLGPPDHPLHDQRIKIRGEIRQCPAGCRSPRNTPWISFTVPTSSKAHSVGLRRPLAGWLSRFRRRDKLNLWALNPPPGHSLATQAPARLINSMPSDSEQEVRIEVDGKKEPVAFSVAADGIHMEFRKRDRSRIARPRDSRNYRAGCEKAWELFPEHFSGPTTRRSRPRQG